MPGLAARLPEGWERSETTSGIPYYINHETETTQWDHPEMVNLMEEIGGLNHIKYSAYRTAMKLRAIQKSTQLYMVDLSVLEATLDEEGLYDGQDHEALSAAEVLKTITSLFVNQNGERSGILDIYLSSELVLNWLLNVYDPGRTGIIQALSVKIGLALMCSANLQDKYRYLFRQIATKQGNVDRKRLKLFLQECLQIPKYIYESTAFSGTSLEPAVKNCFERVNSDRIALEEFLEWMIAEPQTIVWLPTLHRLAVSETVKHESKCNLCKVYPIVGFRYRCLKCFNFDICQECFWSGRVGKNHKIGHPTQEYCLASTQKEDIKDFAKVVKNKVRTKKKKEEQQRNPSKGRYIPIAPEDGPPSSDEEFSVDGPPMKFAPDTHAKLGNYASRLANDEVRDDKSREPTPRSRPLMNDEHQLIQHYASHLAGEPLPSSPSPVQALREAEKEHRRELEGLVSSLENDNRALQSEIHRAHENHQQMVLAYQQHEKETGPLDDEALESDYLRQQHERLTAKEEVLEDHNRQLQNQLHRLRTLLQQGSTPSSPVASRSFPSSHTSPRLQTSFDHSGSSTNCFQPRSSYEAPPHKNISFTSRVSPNRRDMSTNTSSRLQTSLDHSGSSINCFQQRSSYETSPDKNTSFTSRVTPTRRDMSVDPEDHNENVPSANSITVQGISSTEETGPKSSTLRNSAAPLFPPRELDSSATISPRVNMAPSTLIPSNNVPIQPFASKYYRELSPRGPITCREESELQDIVERMTSSFPIDFSSDIPVEVHSDLFVAAGMIGETIQSMVTAVSRYRDGRRGSTGSASTCGQDSITEEDVELFQNKAGMFTSKISGSEFHKDYSTPSSSTLGQEYGPI